MKAFDLGKNAESLFRETLDAMSDHIAVLDDTGRIVFVNLAWKTFADQHGFQAENYGIGLNYLEVCRKAVDQSADGAAEIARGLKEALSGGRQPFSYEYPCHTPLKNRWFRVTITGFSLEDTVRVVVTHQNITELKKAEQERSKSENSLQAIIESVPDAMCMIDREMTVVWINEVGENLFGSWVVGKKCFEAYAGGREICEECIVRNTFADGGIHSDEYTHDDINGIARTFQCTSTVAQVDDRGDPLLVMETLHDITHRKQNEKDMKFMQLAVDTTEDCVYWIRPDGSIRYVNQSALNQTGYAAREIIGLKVADIDLYVDPDNWKSTWQRLKREKVLRFETVHVTKDGLHIPFEVTANYIRIDRKEEYNFAVARNVSDRKQTERQIKKLSRAVEYSPASVVITDIHGTIEYANWKFTEVTGYSYEEVIGENPRILGSGHQTEEYYKTLWDTILAGKEWKGEFINRKKNGDIYWESASISPIKDEHGRIINFVAVKEDITELKRLMQDLNEAKDKAESATRAKSDFLATMSHEIRTPMNAILGMGRLALDSGLNETQYGYVSNILSAADSLLSIINDILDLSKIEAGKMEIESVEFKISSVIEKIFNVIKFRAAEKGLSLVFYFDPRVPWVMKGDPLRLGQVLMNIVNNAVKYTESGEVTVSVKKLHSSGGSVTLKFSIQDSGIGMTEQQVSMLFQPFTQANGTISRKYGGTGLGLVIAKRLAEKMGGKIHVESSPAEGSLFTFTVPLEKVDTKDGEQPFLEKLSGLNVLLIESRENSRKALSTNIEALGMNCCSAGEAGEALRIIDRFGETDTMDILIMDACLCKEDTVEVLKRLGADHQNPNVKSIVLHEFNAAEKARDMTAHMRVHGFLARPVTPLPLVNTILAVTGYGPAGNRENLDQNRRNGEKISEEGKGKRILLVEDNEIGRKVVSEFLTGAGFEVQEALNGEQALEMLEGLRFDLVLMDIEMPVMGGIEATRRIRALEDEHLRHLPVVALTGHVMADFKEKCLAAGMNDHLEKPIRRELLYDMVEKWLKRSDSPKDSVTGKADFDMDVPFIDVKTGMAFAGGKPDLYRRLLDSFVNDFHYAGRRIKEVLSRDERDRARQLVHSIKSEAGHIGAKSFAALCGDLEKVLADEDGMALVTELNEFVSGLGQLLQSVEIVKNRLDSHLMMEEDTVGLPEETDLKEELLHLLEFVRKHQPGDCRRVLKRIGTGNSGTYQAEELKALSELIGKYRFASAENRVLQMLEKMEKE
ncbi:MAG: PAS domain S-box protein [Desulfarculaceae bacterium]|nr:PAS domain S-box protein [Desulfarculaceae bacterium]